MNYIYITGTGSGIGEALAKALLKDKNNKVIGLSRHQTIEHRNYLHIEVDLSKISLIRRFRFERIEKADKIVLVNNAGTLGQVAHIGEMNTLSMVRAYNVNFMAPVIITNEFIKYFRDHPAFKTVINISSGAAQRAVDGWGVYCSSKAGLEMYTRVLDEELHLDGRTDEMKVFSIAPGVVDTPMQEHIRSTEESDFSTVERFRALKEEGELRSPQQVARELKAVIDQPEAYNELIFRL
jgi:benzil reductase ((S)-benzoin forming)